MDNMLDIGFATYEEVCRELGTRLKAQRLAQMLTQEELAVRAGLSMGTVKNIENKGQSSIESVVRLGLALGLADHFQELFKLQVKSIAQMDQAEQSKRIRASRRVIK
jgi:transcriptional regulator with XRE-family HTH domain